jgi:hypothetical protein
LPAASCAFNAASIPRCQQKSEDGSYTTAQPIFDRGGVDRSVKRWRKFEQVG